jgi:hypothetical protein
MSENGKGALRVLLSEIIDYAGLFPPSDLNMESAVQNYADYLQSEHAWMLGRFIVPVDVLDDFAYYAKEFWQTNQTWRLSVLANEDFAETARKIQNFNSVYAGQAIIDVLETKIKTAADIYAMRPYFPAETSTYLEIPRSNSSATELSEIISALAITKVRGKIRTGGVVSEAFPPVDELIKFLRISLAANVPFKATAGLHHPLRAVRPLTYEENSSTATMHGFLNLFLSAAFLRQNLNSTFVHQLMVDVNVSNFEFDDEGARWQNHRVDLTQLKLMRTRGAISFGSCSFIEPIEDLQKIGLL